MNLFQVLVEIKDLCNDALIQAVVGTVKNVLNIISIAVPIVLIVLCTIDMFKAFTNGDDKERSKAWKGAIKRLVFAVIVFIIPWLVKLGFSLIGSLVDTNGDADVKGFETFLVCWNYENPIGSNNSGGSGMPEGKVCCFTGTNDGTPSYSVVDAASCGNKNVSNNVNCGY